MHESTASYHCPVAYLYFTSQLNGIRHDYIVAQLAIMSYMAVSHYKAVVANDCFTFRSCASMNGYELTNAGVVANDGETVFALKLEVLRDVAHYST